MIKNLLGKKHVLELWVYFFGSLMELFSFFFFLKQVFTSGDL
jgi:hypothetical protein